MAMQAMARNPVKRPGHSTLLSLLLVGGLAVCSLAQAAPFSYMKVLKDAERAIGAPGVFAKLEAMDPQQRAAFLDEERGKINTLMTMRSLSGDAGGAAQAGVWFEIASGRTAKNYAALSDKPVLSSTAEDALQAIVREARNRQVVILNEAHTVPLTRVFAGKLARELRKIGFEYLAAEALSPTIPLHPDTVTQDMGFYVKEPMYAGLMRSAIRDGWSFIGYDFYPKDASPADRERLREIGAARNLVEKIFAGNLKAKVLVFVGHGHAMKQQAAREDGWKSVATLLRETLGVDPLTIDQATMYGRGDARVEHPQYVAAMRRFAPTKPIVLRAPGGGYTVLAGVPGGYDMQVFHPDEMGHSKDGRPLWMERQAGLAPHPVPAGLLPPNGRRLIQAFHAADGEGAVPADMVLVEAGKPAPALMLAPGQFRFSYEE